MTRKALFMETTEVAPERTAAEIRVELVKGGASKIMEEYAVGRIVAVTFAVNVDGTDLPFRLPVRPEPIFKVLQKRRTQKPWRREEIAKLEQSDRAQAERIAWRQIYRWVQAQLALCTTGMVTVQEVFFPYLSNGTQSVYEIACQSGFKALPAPSGVEEKGMPR
jgi:hypothetical protein